MIDDFAILRPKLENMQQSAKRRLGPALDEVDAILKLAKACGVGRRILLRPTLSRNAEVREYTSVLSSTDGEEQFFRGGFMFECVRRGKQREIVAFGGR